MKAYQIARLGLARTFQIVQPFPKMTVLENVAAGALFAGRASRVGDDHSAAREHLDFTGLRAIADKPAASLTLAQRKRLEMAKGLAMQPRLLMLDEVFGSLDEGRRTNVLGLLEKLNQRFEQILVITHLDDIKDGVQSLIEIEYDDATGAVQVGKGRDFSETFEI
jgi:branched-chain amino acid transport system ATP-binding protein